MPSEPGAGIARDLKSIEWLKTELTAGIAGLFRALWKNAEESVVDRLANLVIMSYVLGRRLGISHDRLDMKVEQTVRANIDNEHELEEWYGDFSAYLHHIESKKR